MVAPFWKPALQYAKIPALIHAVLYASILIPMILSDEGEPPDVNKMESIFELFQDPNIFFCGWVHYLAFDLLIGTSIAEDSIDLPKVYYYVAVVPCLFLTFNFGPVGFLVHTILKWTKVLPASTTIKAKVQ